MKAIPRRPLIPIITDLAEYRQAAINTIPYTRRMISKYGNVCDVSFTGVRNYFIHDPDVIHEILTTQSPKFKRTYLFRAFRKFLGHGLFTSDGDYHRRQRRLIKPAFYPRRIAGYADVMTACALEEINTWKNGDKICINEAMTRITLRVITRTMFGTGLDNAAIADVGVTLAEAFHVMNDIVQNPFYVFCLEKEIKLPIIKKFFGLRNALDTVINGIIANYRRDGTEHHNDLLSMLMEARDEECGTLMTDEQIRDEVMTFFIAGHETTTIALTWTLYLLGRHPQIADELRSELVNVLDGRIATAADYEALRLCRNVFKESLRLYPPAWTFARENTEDVVICDYFFPKGSVLWTITYLVHHDEQYFADPEAFIPSRWDDERMKELPRYAYFPFGGGPRMCIGEGFAWMEGVLVLATILARYRMVLPPGFTTDIDPMFTLKPKDKVYMTVEKTG